MTCVVIAIDGPAASGKGSIAKEVAQRLNFEYLDTGLLYRLVTAMLLMEEIYVTEKEKIIQLIERIDFSKHSTLKLHSVEVSNLTPIVAAIPEVRQALFNTQKNFAKGKKGVVIEGRDIGTVIFPDAMFKFFITADLTIRANRRFKQLQNSGENIIYDQVLSDLKKRDLQDSNRSVAPLKLETEYHIIDTSYVTLEESINEILRLVKI